MSSLDVWVPIPPSANHIWRSGRGRVYRSAKYMDWLTEAGWQIRAQYCPIPTVTGPYKLSLTAARPDKRKRDLDNLIKPISDLLKAVGVIEDDHLCEMLSLRWATSGEGVNVRIERAGVE